MTNRERQDPVVEPLRIGILGAARITELALIKPAGRTDTKIVMIAARDRSRAEAFAAKYHIPKVVDSYDEVINSDEIEAIYNPLPNSLHGPWNRLALAAGKHVLSEKPSAANARDAQDTLLAAERASGVQFFEGYHYRYHPVIARLHEIVASGEIGTVQQVESVMDMPAPDASDPRWSLELAGGALMDLGCYSLHSHRILAPLLGGEPALVDAKGGERDGHPGVDEWLTAELRFPNGATGQASCNMASPTRQMSHRIIGDQGEAIIPEYINVHEDDRVIVKTGEGTRTEHLGNKSSYTHQLEAFTRAVRTGQPAPTDAADALATMRLIDDCYQAIGLQPRPRHH
jgi:predicted dehydrogenase